MTCLRRFAQALLWCNQLVRAVAAALLSLAAAPVAGSAPPIDAGEELRRRVETMRRALGEAAPRDEQARWERARPAALPRELHDAPLRHDRSRST